MVEFLCRKALKLIDFAAEFIKYILLYPIARIMYRNRQIFIFSERGTDARDNGYYMFRYFRQVHPELEAYYIITKESADYEKVRKLGNVVEHSSLKHYLLFIVADYKISSHIMGFSPNIGFYTRFADILQLKGHRIFLQHGVIKDYLPYVCRSNTKMTLFICGAKPEYDYVLQNFGHPSNVVRYTGLARYDGLHDFKVKNQILIMPTWRGNLITEKAFLSSEYFKKWQDIISNEMLIKKLEEYNIKLIFYVHYEMQKYLKHFITISDSVVLAKFEDYDVQTLLKESAMLVTDYSSVYFDFAYMKKPVVYYHFDENHYPQGYFDYKTMGFGDVYIEEDDVVTSILKCFDNEFKMESEFQERTDAFFPLHDTNNCKRIYDCIMEI